MANILVTGGCGFLGTWILRRLLDDGDRVTVLDLQRNTRRWEMILTPAEIAAIPFHSVPIDDPEAVKSVVETSRADAIIHLAGLQVPTCRDNPILGARVNVLGTLSVFEAARALGSPEKGFLKIVYASSAAVFGPDAEYAESITNDSATRPTSHYGAYKLCNENSAKSYWLAHKLPSIGLRPLTVYGPGRDIGMTSFPTRAIAAAVKGVSFQIPFSGPTAYLHARECADLFVTCARRPIAEARAYTVGGDIADVPTFIRTLDAIVPGAAKLISATGGPLPVASKMDDAELRRDVPGLIRVPLEQGIRETVDIYRKLNAAGKLEV